MNAAFQRVPAWCPKPGSHAVRNGAGVATAEADVTGVHSGWRHRGRTGGHLAVTRLRLRDRGTSPRPGTPGPATGRGSAAGRRRSRSAVQVVHDDLVAAADALGDVVAGEFDVDAAGMVPSARCTSKKPLTSSSTSSKRRVLCPLDASKVLPCIGSQTQATSAPVAVTFSTSAGSLSRTLPAPMRMMKVSRPGSRSGSSARDQRQRLVARSVVGPSLTPIGLRICARTSTCAPSSWRVRSPIQTMCAGHVVRLPVRRSIRVSAGS